MKTKPRRPRDSDKRHDDMYRMFDELRKISEMKTYQESGTPAYLKMIQTGKIGLFDYDRGFLGVQICVAGHEEGKYCAIIYFATADDGSMGGWSKEMDKADASTLVVRIAREVFNDMAVLPTRDEMNVLLRPYGIFVGQK